MISETLHHDIVFRFFSITNKHIDESNGTWRCTLNYQGTPFANFDSKSPRNLSYSNDKEASDALVLLESIQFKQSVTQQLNLHAGEQKRKTLTNDEAFAAVAEILFYQSYLIEQKSKLHELCESSLCVGNLNEFHAIGFGEPFTKIIAEIGKKEAGQLFQQEYDKLKPTFTKTNKLLNSPKQLKEIGIRI